MSLSDTIRNSNFLLHVNVLSEFRVKFSLMFVLLQRAEENAHAFLDKEMKKLWRGLFPDYPQCSESEREEEAGKKGEQRRRAIEGVVDITKLCLMEMNQEELADALLDGKTLLSTFYLVVFFNNPTAK